MVWTVWVSNPVRARFFAPFQTGPGAHPASCTTGTESFLGVKSGRGVTLTPHPLLVSWSRKSRAIPLLPLWAVCSVQSFSACTRVHFTLPYIESCWANIIHICNSVTLSKALNKTNHFSPKLHINPRFWYTTKHDLKIFNFKYVIIW